MFNETSFNSGASYLGPPRKQRSARCGPRDLGCANPSPPVEHWAYDPLPPNSGHPYGDDMAVPPTPVIGIPPVEGGNVGTGFDIGALLSGTTFGLPTWVLAAGAAWFFFFRKGR